MKKLLIGILALGSISAYADCLSDVKTKLMHIDEVSGYHSKLSENIDETYNSKDYDSYGDLKKANDKLWEKVEKLAAQVCTSAI